MEYIVPYKYVVSGGTDRDIFMWEPRTGRRCVCVCVREREREREMKKQSFKKRRVQEKFEDYEGETSI